MELPRAQFTVRRMMVGIAAVAFLLMVVYRCGPAIVLANYHADHEAYHRDRLAWFLQIASEGGANQERWSGYADYHRNQATYHAYWKRAFRLASARPWERLLVPSQGSPPWRSIASSQDQLKP
jgi:hypothetical protein